MTAQKYTPHIFSLAALFTVGNAIISAQKINVISVVLSFAIIFAVSILLKTGQKNKAVFLGTSFFAFIAAAYGAVTAFLGYIQFLKKEQLPQTGWLLLVSAFLLSVVLFSFSKIHAIYKYCLLVFIAVVAIMVICFVGGLKTFEYKNFDKDIFDFSISLKDTLLFCLPVVVLPFACEGKTRPNFYGVMVCFFMLFISVLQSCLTIGVGTDVRYPYLKAVSVISSGSLFTRLDGLIWFVFFVTSLIKTTVCIKVALKIINGGR